MAPLRPSRLLLCLVLPLVHLAPAGDSAPPEPRPGSAPDAPAAGDHDVARQIIAENVRAMLDSGFVDRAVREVARLLRRAPDSPEARLLAAEAYARAGQEAEAVSQAVAARNLDASSIEADRWLARLARARGRLAEARQHLHRALERRPDTASLLSEIALLHAAEGETRRAKRLFRRAAALPPDEPRTALDAALALEEPRRRRQALERLRKRFPGYAPASAWAALCAAAGEAVFWQAEPWASGLEIPIQIDDKHFPMVVAEIADGETARVLLDTGASGLKISRELAERVGLKPFGSLQVGGLGAGGTTAGGLVLIERLRLGSLTLRNVPATVLASLPVGEALLNPMALGAEAIRLDMSRRVLILGDNEDLVPEGAAPLQFLNLDQHPVVKLFVNGRVHLAMIDSGSGATILDDSVLRQIPERRPMVIENMQFTLSGVAGVVRKARPVHVSRLRLGPLELEDPLLFEADLSRLEDFLGTQVQILFGADFLSRFDATFDYRRLEVTLEPANRPRSKRLKPGS